MKIFVSVITLLLLLLFGVYDIRHVQSLDLKCPMPSQKQTYRRRTLSMRIPNQQNSNTNTVTNVQHQQQQKPAIELHLAASSMDIVTSRDVTENKARKIVQIIHCGNVKAQTFLQKYPFAAAIIITTLNAVCADLITQLVLERGAASTAVAAGASAWDWKRTATFGVFGFVFQGLCQYAIVNWGWERLFPGTSQRAVASKVCGMNLISDPLLFFPAFYLFKQFLVWQTGGATSAAAAAVEGTTRLAVWTSFVSSALSNYQQNAWQDWMNSWIVWFPGHAVTYGIMPKHKRIPWIAFLSFFYMCVLSLTRGGT